MLSRRTAQHNGRLDQLSIAISVLCLGHCALVPLVVVAVPFVGMSAAVESYFHQVMLLVILPISVIAIGQGLRQHRSIGVAALAALGISLLAVAATLLHGLVSEWPEIMTTVAGSLILLAAHWQNLRLSRSSAATQLAQPAVQVKS